MTYTEKKQAIPEIKIKYGPRTKSKVVITDSHQCAQVLHSIWDQDLINIQEQFMVLLLNSKNQVLGYRIISTGAINNTFVDMKIIFGIVCKSLATSIIVAHNHPTGEVEPSPDDILVTQKIKKTALLFGVCLLDHFILGRSQKYYSFQDHNMLDEVLKKDLVKSRKK